jgi:uncharacterized protein YbjT (DUF2867 family)
MSRLVYISGGTGYLGASLIPLLASRGHSIRALCRPGSERKLAAVADPVPGDALDPRTFSPAGFDTFVHLVGTPHPAPWKGAQFRAVDLRSLEASVAAAKLARVEHFVYVSVAHPAPVMKEYIAVRTECEQIVMSSGMRASILRPWYVLGPGHRWPYALKPLYWICEQIPGLSDGARRLGLVTREQMVETLAWSIENPPERIRISGVEDIRRISHYSVFANTPPSTSMVVPVI